MPAKQEEIEIAPGPEETLALASEAVPFIEDDGGRVAAGFRGEAGDCAVRAIAITSGLPYQEVYDAINAQAARERRRTLKASNARTGVQRDTMCAVLETLVEVRWTPTMFIGQGCKVHLRADELPSEGRHILSLSRHYAAWMNGVLHDTYDCSRGGTRCVYGYWTLTKWEDDE